MMNKTLEKNLQALSLKNPSLVQKLLNCNPSGFEFIQTESGNYNLFINGIPIHNTCDPIQEAKLIFGKEEEDQNNLRVVFGLGLGYLFKRVFTSSKSTIILFEPSIEILKATLQAVDFSLEIIDRRVFIITDITEIQPIFLKYLFEKVSILHLNYYKKMFPKLYEKVYFELNRFYLDQQTNISRLESIANSVVGNILYIANLPSATVLKDIFINKTILIVGAGPSLNQSIDIIRMHRSKFIVISIGQAFNALCLSDIVPDFVIVIDLYSTPRQIEASQEIKNKINLILQPGTDINFFKEKFNSTFIYYPSPDFLSEWLANKDGSYNLKQAGSVSLCAFYLALELGAKEIILVGQDLAYSEGNIYASNSSPEEIKYIENEKNEIDFYLAKEGKNELLNGETLANKNKIIQSLVHNHKEVIKVAGQKGEMLTSSCGYASFITQYSQIAEKLLINNPHIKLINASVGGAYINGFEHKPLDKCIETLSDNIIGTNELITSIYKNEKDDRNLKLSLNKLVIDLNNLIIDAEKVIKHSEKMLEEIKRTKTLSTKVLETYKKLQKYNQKVQEYNINNRISFIYPFMQKELFEHNRVKDKIGLNDLERLLYSTEEICHFSKIMIIGSKKVITKFEKLEEFPFQL